MEIIKCGECGAEIEKANDCPLYCKNCNSFICPECYHELKGEHIEYCGDNCNECGWSHCGGCV